MTPYYDSRSKIFNEEYAHNRVGKECAHCGLSFAHVHPKGSGLKDFIMPNKTKPNPETKKEKGASSFFFEAIKDDPQAIIEWCEREIEQYQSLIRLIKDNSLPKK